MSEDRIELTYKAFSSLDKGMKGEVNIELVKSRYNARSHPDVLSGKIREDEALFEFLESFDEHHHYLVRDKKLGSVSAEEFLEYFSNVSACIEDDEEYASIITNVWKFVEAKPIMREEVKAVPTSAYKSPGKKGASNVSSIDNTLHLSAKLHNKFQEQKHLKDISGIIEKVRDKLSKRGVRGVIGIHKQFKVTI